MQSVSSRIWTRVAVFISYDDNNYTTGTSQSKYNMKNEISKYLYITGEIKNVKNVTGTVLPIVGGTIETTVKNLWHVLGEHEI